MAKHERVLLIDDLRDFRDGRETLIARTSAQALAILADRPELDELWLDHDLGELADGRVDSIMSVVDFLNGEAAFGAPYPVQVVYVHTSNPVGAQQMMAGLQRYGYTARRVNAPDVFIVHD